VNIEMQLQYLKQLDINIKSMLLFTVTHVFFL